jgi:hypothetical protein
MSTVTSNAAEKKIPQYVLDYAPLVYMSTKDQYFPSSISHMLTTTRPQISFKDVPIPSPPLTLDNLSQLNTVGAKGGADIYLTSFEDIGKRPAWLKGVKPGPDLKTGNEITGVVLVADKGKGEVDVFYFYFFAFNWGGVVLGNDLGHHVGDWEHNMIRFVNGEPKAVWFSQHGNGQAFEYKILKKDSKTGKRPLIYCGNGSHALYAIPGVHDHTLPNLNLPVPFVLVDNTDAGPLWDPLLNSWFYEYQFLGTPTASASTATPGAAPAPPQQPLSSSPLPTLPQHSFNPYIPGTPVSYLHYKGRWGDAQYPDNDKRQKQLAGNRKYVGGPTGPADKQLWRKEVWPQNTWAEGQRVRKELTA